MTNPDDAPAPSIIPDEVPSTTPPPPPPPRTMTIANAVDSFAALVKRTHTTHRVTEGTATRLLELALNQHFTMIQMGLARPTSTATEDPHGSQEPSES